MFSAIIEWLYDYREMRDYSIFKEKFKQQVIAANKRRGGYHGR